LQFGRRERNGFGATYKQRAHPGHCIREKRQTHGGQHQQRQLYENDRPDIEPRHVAGVHLSEEFGRGCVWFLFFVAYIKYRKVCVCGFCRLFRVVFSGRRAAGNCPDQDDVKLYRRLDTRFGTSDETRTRPDRGESIYVDGRTVPVERRQQLLRLSDQVQSHYERDEQFRGNGLVEERGSSVRNETGDVRVAQQHFRIRRQILDLGQRNGQSE